MTPPAVGWNPELYLRFADERTQPAVDLAGRVRVASPKRVMDLGCGPGNSTAVLRRRWPDADITGLDNSAEMLAAAAKSDAKTEWMHGDLNTWTDAPVWDVVFSNAALQWVPDHGRVFPQLFSAVLPGGALAIQVPLHFESPLHKGILEAAEQPEWRSRMTAARDRIAARQPGFYYDVLASLASRIELWTTTYFHVMSDAAAILTWIRGTGLRPFLESLSTDDERTRFESELLSIVVAAYPPQQDGRVLFPFQRLFVVAYRDGEQR